MSQSSPLAFVRRPYQLLVRAASSLQSLFLLAVRLYWGWQFYVTGKGKLEDHGRVTGFFTSIHIPFPSLNAWFVGSLECVGGIFLLIGLASRLTAIPLIVTLIVAYLTTEMEAIQNIYTDPDKFTGAAPFLFLFATLCILIFGPGVFSVDYLLGKNSEEPKQEARPKAL